MAKVRIHTPKRADHVRGIYVDSRNTLVALTVGRKRSKPAILRTRFMVGVVVGRFAAYRISL